MGAWLGSMKRNQVYALAMFLALLAGGGLTAAAMLVVGGGDSPVAAAPVTPTPSLPPSLTPTNTPIPSPTPIRFAGILDGVPMSESEWQSRKDLLPIAVMFDNSPDAFPQAGLDKADVVYEAFVEGGITRFMGVYWRQEAEYLEPVRSARTPFVVWADELGAMYAHAGEAVTDNGANAGGQIEEWGIKDLTAFGGEADVAYFRDSDRYAPHNLVTGTTALREAAKRLHYAGPPSLAPWLFKADGEGTAGYPQAGGIEINFQGTRYPWQLIQWHWDPQTNLYGRYQFGGPHFDARTEQQLMFKNIIVMTVGAEVVDESGHVLLDQLGSGKAMVFLDGRQIDATWKKADRKSRTRLYDKAGAEIAFDRGSTFIEVVGFESAVTVAVMAAGLPKIPAYVPPPPAAPDSTDSGGVSPTQSASNSPSPSASKSPTATASGTPQPGASSSPQPSGTGTASAGTPSATQTPPQGSATTVPTSATTAPSPSQAATPPTAAATKTP